MKPSVASDSEPGVTVSASARRLGALDGLRGLGALMVVFGHAFDGHDSLFWLPTLMDFFFIYSGFFISRSLLRTRLDGTAITGFYWRRAVRIWPLYFVVVTAAFALNAWMLSRNVGPRVDFSAMAVLRHLTFVQYTPAYFGLAEAPGGILEHTWSLAIEEQFYLVCPWVLCLLAWRPRWTLVLLAALALLAVHLRIAGLDTYLFATRLDSFALGLVLGWASLRPGLLESVMARRVWRAAFAVLGFVWLGILLSSYRDLAMGRGIEFVGYGHRLLAGGIAKLFYASIIAGVVVLPNAAAFRWLGRGWLAECGRLCYPIYMIHYPVMLFGASAFVFFTGRSHELGALLMVPLILVLARQWALRVDGPVENRLRDRALRPRRA